MNASAKEVEEETSLTSLWIYKNQEVGFIPFSSNTWGEIFDVDIHKIPELKETPAHYHYDIRYLFLAENPEQLRCSEESLDAKWVKLSEIEQYTKEESIVRMVEKIKLLK